MKNYKVGDRVWLKEQKKVAEISLITKPHSTQYYMKDMQGFWFEDEITQSAQTMFEELGFTKSVDDGVKIAYANGVFAAILDVKDKTYTFSDRSNQAFYMDIDIHLAIHQKMTELGWIE